MARDKNAKGITAFVRVGKDLAREYPNNGSEKITTVYTLHGDESKANICYIESVSGEQFRIETTVDTNIFNFDNNDCDGLKFSFYIDGQLMSTEVYDNGNISQKQIACSGFRVPVGNGKKQLKGFRFSELKMGKLPCPSKNDMQRNCDANIPG